MPCHSPLLAGPPSQYGGGTDGAIVTRDPAGGVFDFGTLSAYLRLVRSEPSEDDCAAMIDQDREWLEEGGERLPVARSEIVNSWRRSQSCGVNPDDVQMVEGEVHLETKIARTAIPVLEATADILREGRTSLLLSAPDGTMVWRWSDDSALRALLDRRSAVVGTQVERGHRRHQRARHRTGDGPPDPDPRRRPLLRGVAWIHMRRRADPPPDHGPGRRRAQRDHARRAHQSTDGTHAAQARPGNRSGAVRREHVARA